MKKKILPVICLTAVFLLAYALTVIIGGAVARNGENTPTEPATAVLPTKPTEKSGGTKPAKGTKKKPTQKPTQKPTEQASEGLTQPPSNEAASGAALPTQKPAPPATEGVEQPQQLTFILQEGGVSYEMLDSLNCSQLVAVRSAGNTAELSMFSKNALGAWASCNLDTPGYVGKNGVSANSSEGSYQTPAGLFALRQAFYIYDKPATGLDTFQITENTYWVDDPSSQYYNQRVEGTANADWNSAEHMISYAASYKYGCVIEFNTTDIVKGKGSAMFFHCGTAPTAGCVAVEEGMMLEYLSRLDLKQNPYILIM